MLCCMSTMKKFVLKQAQVLNTLSTKIKALNRRKDSEDLLKLSCPEIAVLSSLKFMMLVICSRVAKVSAGAPTSRRP